MAAVFGIASTTAFHPAAADDVAREFARCRAMAESEARLGCYDKLASRVVPPRFAGRLTVETEQFRIDAPTVLRFQSDGPIFVMYLRDANTKFVASSSSYDYIQSDDTHPTYTGGTVSAGLWGGSTGTGASRYPSISNGRNPIWNQYGHERMGWALSVYQPANP